MDTAKYSVIYCDCPWDYGGRKQHGSKDANKSVEDHYPTMKLDELRKLRISDICEPNCVIFLWTSSPHLEQAIELLKAWGFKYKTIAFVWDKQKLNPGAYTMSQCEICLVATKGTIPKPRGTRNERQFLSSLRGRHSEKPAEIRTRISRMFPTQRKIELFARNATEGWAVWGNEIENTVNLNTIE